MHGTRVQIRYYFKRVDDDARNTGVYYNKHRRKQSGKAITKIKIVLSKEIKDKPINFSSRIFDKYDSEENY